MGSIASDLKIERQKRNISLAQIAADTRISLHYLESLEEGRYSELPGGMYNRAFLRAYCERLNLNQQDILSRYEAEISPPMDKVLKSKVHINQKNTTLKPSPVLIWSLMLLISATGLFFSRKWIASVFSPYFSRKPAATISQEITEPKIPATTTEPSPPIVNQDMVLDAPPQPVDTQSADSTASAPLSDPILAPKTQNAIEPDPATTASTPLLRLEIGISEKCWVSIDRDGSPVVRKLMDPGEIQSLDANQQFLLIVGNAGGVHLKINGKPAKPLGKSGEVVKIFINEKNLQDLLDRAAG
jgi:cytoskeleton protein RodZ